MNTPLVVIDASVALAWCLPDTAANVREARADNRIIAVVTNFSAAEIAYRLMKLARSNPTLLTVAPAQAVAPRCPTG